MTFRLFVSITLALTVSIHPNLVSAFAIAPATNSLSPSTTVGTTVPVFQKPAFDKYFRGGSMKESSAPSEAPKAPIKRVRISALDGIRFLLATHIVLGHFLRYANPTPFLLAFFSQINVSVGSFFALSGYVTAYTTTEVGQRVASPKLTGTPSQKWFISKAMSYYPMHWLVLLVFSPMFILSDLTYGTPIKTAFNGLLSATLTQAWFPMSAEVWNAPTWFLSALTFSTALMPFCLPKIAEMDKRALRKTGFWLFLINLLPVIGYVYDSNVWTLVEGMTIPKKHPALALFNSQRFFPVFNVAEYMMGIIACRLCMLDSLDDKDKTPKTNSLSTAVPLVGLLTILVGRAAGFLPDVNDLLVRGILFTPLFLKFVMGAHRNAVSGTSDPVAKLLSNPLMLWLGGLTFPIFIVHGPIGKMFYQKLIAQKLWGKVLFGPGYFAAYLGAVLLAALALQKGFLQNKAVGEWSKKTGESFASWM